MNRVSKTRELINKLKEYKPDSNTDSSLNEGLFDFVGKKSRAKKLIEKLQSIYHMITDLDPVPRGEINRKMVSRAIFNIVEMQKINNMVKSDPELSKVWKGAPNLDVYEYGIIRSKDINSSTLFLGGKYGLFTKPAEFWITTDDSPHEDYGTTVKNLIGGQLSTFVNSNIKHAQDEVYKLINELKKANKIQ